MEHQTEITSDQIRAARALLGWTQEQLAEKADVTRKTLRKLESEIGPLSASTVLRITGALEAAGVDFIRQGSRYGVMLEPRRHH